MIDRYDLEGDLDDLARMASIAITTAQDVVGDTEFRYSGDDGTVFEVMSHRLTPDAVSQTMFAVIHLLEMIRAVQRKHVENRECASVTSGPSEPPCGPPRSDHYSPVNKLAHL